MDSTVQGVKNSTGKAIKATVGTAKTVGNAIASGAEGIRQVAERITTRNEPGQQE